MNLRLCECPRRCSLLEIKLNLEHICIHAYTLLRFVRVLGDLCLQHRHHSDSMILIPNDKLL